MQQPVRASTSLISASSMPHPKRHCLHPCPTCTSPCPCRYGNTSSSTVWYSFGYIESVQGVRKGDIVWQVGL